MKRLAALALIATSCSAPSGDVAITREPPKPKAHPRLIELFHERAARSTTTEPVRVEAASVPQPQPEPASPPVGHEHVVSLIYTHFGNHGAEAVRVAVCESTLNPAAKNGVHVGLFQLSGTYHRPRAARLGFEWQRMYEAEPNIIVAADLWREQGWRPWSCKP